MPPANVNRYFFCKSRGITPNGKLVKSKIELGLYGF
jgi:hypothetical protein